jgi:hypothetical protein
MNVLRHLAAGLLAAGLPIAFCSAQTSAAARNPHFVDVVPRSQISYVTNNDYTGRKYFQQPICGGIAILDYDNDG